MTEAVPRRGVDRRSAVRVWILTGQPSVDGAEFLDIHTGDEVTTERVDVQDSSLAKNPTTTAITGSIAWTL
jgi:hypothetical protein